MIFELPDWAQSIAVLYSGGVDSTVMLYSVALAYPDRKIVAITAGCSYIDDHVNLPFAAQMLERLLHKLPAGAINEHVVTYHDDRVGHHCGQYMNENSDRFDVWLVGQNAAPAKGSTISDKNGEVWDLFDRCPLDSRKEITQPNWDVWEGHTVFKPLLHLDKKEVFALARNYEIYDDIVELSRSCPQVYNNETIADFEPHCGKCWWCLERKWGMSMEPTVAEIYNAASADYDEKYVQGDDNEYLRDERLASFHWHQSGLGGNIVSLGVGSGQDIEILGRPFPENFRGFDISTGMLDRAADKFPEYNFTLHDCNMMLTKDQPGCDVLVSMFGPANYLGVNKLVGHYEHLGCTGAFFVFYNENYVDGVINEYHTYSKQKLEKKFEAYNATVLPLEEGSNYYVVWWDETRSI